PARCSARWRTGSAACSTTATSPRSRTSGCAGCSPTPSRADPAKRPEREHPGRDRDAEVARAPRRDPGHERGGDANLPLAELALERRRDERGEHGDRHEVQAAHPEGGQFEPQRESGVARAERHRHHPRQRQPERHATSRTASSTSTSSPGRPLVSAAPSRLPTTPVRRIGRPPGRPRAATYAITPEATATRSSTRARTSGTSSARNASGKTRSIPSSAGSVIADPAIAPPSVARFHMANRLSSAPNRNENVLSPLAATTPKASSVRK